MTYLIVEPSYPINSRTERFRQSISEAFGENSVKVVCWNRDGRSTTDNPNYFIFDKIAGYGNPKAKLFGLADFYTFLKQKIKEINPDFIIASHWDSLILSAMAKPKGARLIYENLDMPTGKVPVRSALRFLEKRALSKTDCITFASRFFMPYYKQFKGSKILVENKLPKAMCVELPQKKSSGKLTVTFLGVVRHAVIMENLMKAISGMDDVEFKVFGGGPFFESIKAIAGKYTNVTMYGTYDYSQVPGIYAQSDLIWAVYPYHDFNVKLAISNKYHEALYFGVPGIFCKGTKLGDMVAAENIGLAVDCDSVDDIRRIILDFKDNRSKRSAEIAQNLERVRQMENDCWEDEIAPFIAYLKIADKTLKK